MGVFGDVFGSVFGGVWDATPTPIRNLFAEAWYRNYLVQNRMVGITILATVTGFAKNKPAVISEVDLNDIFIEGGHAEGGGWNLQMRVSDLSADPPKRTLATCNGTPGGLTLEVLNFKKNNGIAYLVLVDFTAETK